MPMRIAILGVACLMGCLMLVFPGCLNDEQYYGDKESSSMKYTGDTGSVLSYGAGVVVSVDKENMIAVIKMNNSGIYANKEVGFDFYKHTVSQPVELDKCKSGDNVKVTYFNTQTSHGLLAGESLVLLTNR